MIYLGVILLFIGLIIRFFAVKQMKQNFSVDTNRIPKTFCSNGLFGIVRHPCYAGSVIALAGIAILSVEIAVSIIAILFFIARAINEEQILTTIFGKQYLEYKKKTGMFFPRLFSYKKKEL